MMDRRFRVIFYLLFLLSLTQTFLSINLWTLCQSNTELEATYKLTCSKVPSPSCQILLQKGHDTQECTCPKGNGKDVNMCLFRFSADLQCARRVLFVQMEADQHQAAP